MTLLKNVVGDLDISSTYVTKIHEGLIVGGNLNAYYNSVKIVENNVQIGENAQLSFTPLILN